MNTTTRPPRGSTLNPRRFGQDLRYLLGVFFLSLAAFVVTVPVFFLGVGLAVLTIGLFVMVAALVVAGWFATQQRVLLRSVGAELPTPEYPAAGRGYWGKLRRMSSTQSWRDLVHVFLSFIVSLVSFPLTVTWLVGAPAGLTYGFWQRYLPEQDGSLADILGNPFGLTEVGLNTFFGLFFLVTLPFVVRGLVMVHYAFARMLLVDEKPQLRRQVAHLEKSRSAAGVAEVHTLRKLERDLHDGPQQRLVRLGMDLSSAQRKVRTDPESAESLLADARTQAAEALAEIRRLSRGLAPPALENDGLHSAVTALAAQGRIPTSVDVAAEIDESDTLGAPVRNALYYVVAEALANKEKHSKAHYAQVDINVHGPVVLASVSDDGVGGASKAKGHGLAGLAERVEGVGGSLIVDSPPGGPTRVTATVPRASSTLSPMTPAPADAAGSPTTAGSATTAATEVPARPAVPPREPHAEASATSTSVTGDTMPLTRSVTRPLNQENRS